MHSIEEGVEQTDDHTVIIYLDVPGSNVVMLQGYFELYEGVGLVRTLDIKRSLVCIITTPSLKGECLKILDEIRDVVKWNFAQISDEQKEAWLGYTKKK